jgi:hypothetical protein
MRERFAILTLLALVGAVALGAQPAKDPNAAGLAAARAFRKELRNDKAKLVACYRFDPTGDYLPLATQAAKRGQEAADAWQARDRDKPVVVVTRSPWGGGETPTTYWPEGMKPELIKLIMEPLQKADVKFAFAEDAVATINAVLATQPAPPGADAPATLPAVAWPATGFDKDAEFVLLIGMHYEHIPFKGNRGLDEEGKAMYERASRVNAWAILIHAPTATAFWGATAVGRVRAGVTLANQNAAAFQALTYLDFTDFGKENIAAQVAALPALDDLPVIDAAAMFIQSQRGDAAQAVVDYAMSKQAFKNTAAVLRWFNEQGTPQDFRIPEETVKKQGCSLVSQRIILQTLLIEQLRGVRSISACIPPASIVKTDDPFLGLVGKQYAGLIPPASGDEETLLIGELAVERPDLGPFATNLAQAIRDLGKCKTHVPEARAVATVYAERPVPPPPPNKPAPRDALKEAGKDALTNLAGKK